MSDSNHSFNLQTVLSEDFIRITVFPEIEKDSHSFASKKETLQITEDAVVNHIIGDFIPFMEQYGYKMGAIKSPLPFYQKNDTQVSTSVYRYIREDKHLPLLLKDFHNQKNLFALLAKEASTDLSFISSHIIIIDYYLEYCAILGYKLYKRGKKGKDLSSDINALRGKRMDALKGFLSRQ